MYLCNVNNYRMKYAFEPKQVNLKTSRTAGTPGFNSVDLYLTVENNTGIGQKLPLCDAYLVIYIKLISVGLEF